MNSILQKKYLKIFENIKQGGGYFGNIFFDMGTLF